MTNLLADPTIEVVVTLLRDILAELQAQRADRTVTAPGPPLSRADRDRLLRVLPAIVGAHGSEPFIAIEVLELTAVRLVTDGLNAKQLGRLFRRAVGRPVAGFVVEAAGMELHRTLWRVTKTV